MSGHWANAAQWIAATGTAAATLIAATALSIQQRDRRRANAEHVTAWLELGEQEPIVFHFSNTSPVPVYELIAVAVFYGETIRAVTLMPVLPPGEHSKALDQLYDPDHLDATYPPTVAFKFRDPAGRSWSRDAKGRLTRLRRGYNSEQEYMEAWMGIEEGPEGGAH